MTNKIQWLPICFIFLMITVAGCSKKVEDDINVHLIALTTILEEGRSHPVEAIDKYEQYMSDNESDIMAAQELYSEISETMTHQDFLSKYQPIFRRYDTIFDAFISDFPVSEENLISLTKPLPIP